MSIWSRQRNCKPKAKLTSSKKFLSSSWKFQPHLINLHCFLLGPMFSFKKAWSSLPYWKDEITYCALCLGNNKYIYLQTVQNTDRFQAENFIYPVCISLHVALRACAKSRDLKDAIFYKEIFQGLKLSATIWTLRVLQLCNQTTVPKPLGRFFVYWNVFHLSSICNIFHL